MKKILVFLLAAAMLSFVSCAALGSEKGGEVNGPTPSSGGFKNADVAKVENPVEIGENSGENQKKPDEREVNPDGDIVMKPQFEVYDPSADSVGFTIENHSGRELYYGAYYIVEKLTDGAWYAVESGSMTFHEMLYLIGDGDVQSGVVDLQYIRDYGEGISDGRYRVLKIFDVDNKVYAAEFEVGESPVTAESPYGFAPIETLTADFSADSDGVINLTQADEADCALAEEFFKSVKAGLGAQIRLADEADGKVNVTDVVYDGEKFVCTSGVAGSGDFTTVYYSFAYAFNEDIFLSNHLPHGEYDEDVVILSGKAFGSLAEKVNQLYRIVEDTPTYRKYSPDGQKCASLNVNGIALDNREIGKGQMLAYDRGEVDEFIWNGKSTQLCIKSADDENGLAYYDFYDAETFERTSYTSSWYGYAFTEDGEIAIPE